MEKIDVFNNEAVKGRTKNLPKGLAHRYEMGVAIAGILTAIGIGSEDEDEVDKTMKLMENDFKKLPRQFIEDGINITEIYEKENMGIYECADMYYGIRR